jgi:hypothetical protein
MTSKWCGLCQRRHYFQAEPEIAAPRRETPRDVAVGIIAWGVVLAAYFLALAWVVSK